MGQMISDKRLKNAIPSLVSIIRIILAPLFLIAFLENNLILSICIYTIAVATDAIDGYLARILDSVTPLGAYLDITADLILILTGFVAFTIKGIYPYWILILIIIMFLQFIITSKFKVPVYDPIGKYYGAFLFLVIFITLIADIFHNNYLNYILLILIVIFTAISLISRLFFIIKLKNQTKNK
ncbi:MAG: CDP-alcohol phosphatidyltransferase family protein [Methanobacteriales archaeon HGW-Methanobacteriales-1]|jgi:CDP-diacylglycerol--glycerol-3-phosphate 3-phosphatidyltransferase/cardiolipin synthase|nr:MAG: CDP-alcohol phosphatidyltransferase family protein [Methanobacteriales archaeon HGW-Methanobacteriales-1]